MYQRILVPLDGSPTSNLALEHAATLARLSGATLVLVHVIEELRLTNGYERPIVYIREVRPRFLQAGQDLLDAARDRLTADALTVDTVLLESSGERVSECIAREADAQSADLIVLGTHGRRGIDRLLLGSDAEQLARIASIPVMLVRDHRHATQQPDAHG